MNLKYRTLVYITLISLIFSFSACDWLIYDFYDDDPLTQEGNTPVVYLNIQRAAHKFGEESLNEDADDYEDRVHDLATLIFDSSTGAKVASYFDANIPFTNKNAFFTVQLPTGLRDFYFVANMDMSELAAITTKAQMDSYMNRLLNLDEDLYLNATNAKGFPMARVYLNQSIVEGGNVYSPEPFYPVNELAQVESRVKLIRTVAKLEVKLVGSAADMAVETVTYRNAYRQFSLKTLPVQGSPVFYVDKPMKKTGNVYTYYMPEAILATPTWLGVGNNRPINYFVIKTTQGIEHEIPIISHDAPISSSNYLKFAKGEMLDQPDYSIFRNRRYYYEIEKLQAIEVLYQVEEWNEVKTYTYMGYGYNVFVDDEGNVEISNTVDACDPHSVKLQTQAGFKFADDNSNEKTFNTLSETAIAKYEITPIPQSGDGVYLKVFYNGEEVKEFSK